MQRSLLSIFFNESGRVPISLNIVEEKYFCTKYNGKIVQGCSRYGIINERCLLIKLWALRQLAVVVHSRRGDRSEKSSTPPSSSSLSCRPGFVAMRTATRRRRRGVLPTRMPSGGEHRGFLHGGGSQEVVAVRSARRIRPRRLRIHLPRRRI